MSIGAPSAEAEGNHPAVTTVAFVQKAAHRHGCLLERSDRPLDFGVLASPDALKVAVCSRTMSRHYLSEDVSSQFVVHDHTGLDEWSERIPHEGLGVVAWVRERQYRFAYVVNVATGWV